MEFDWDPAKRSFLIEDREIDLADMKQAFDGRPRLTFPSPRDDEERFVSVFELNGKAFAVVWMWRGEVLRLVTARRARPREEQALRESLMEGGHNERKN